MSTSGGSSGGGLTSFNGRTAAAAVPTAGDYKATQVPNVIVAVTQSATPSFNSTTGTVFEILSLAQAITSLTDSGTPVDGQEMTTVFSDNGTARAITPGSGWVLPSGVTLTTTPSTDLYVRWMYSSALTAWVYQSSNLAVSSGGALTSASGSIGADVLLGVTPTTWLTTAPLAVGVWLVTVSAMVYAASNNYGVDLGVAVGTATATFSGPTATSQYTQYDQISDSFTFIATVTVAGTLLLQGQSTSATNTNVKALSNLLGRNASGYTAVKIA
jgi:hypothetical protein